jgi:predicted ATPase
MQIRTPDQRLRVFISSTLAELARERAVVARTISSLGLTPVLFELGARPYPPRELYRAYLAQSDVFLGIYWQRYGWVGPEMAISGLEDEFDLSVALPRLLYIKTPAPDREPELEKLIERIERNAADCYRTFSAPSELARLVRDDLALLLSERFASAAASTVGESAATRRRPSQLPVSTTSLVGREESVEEVCDLLGRPSVRMVTLTGPGGVGKTRLALAVGERLRKHFPGGVIFVSLASVHAPELLLPSIATAAGVPQEQLQTTLDAWAEYLPEAPTLLVLDNLEQLLEAAPGLVELLARCPALSILATSRTSLRVRPEHEYPVAPLDVPPPPSNSWFEQLAVLPAVELFVDRAHAVRPGFELTPSNVLAVAEICRRLEGLPLAIELAAARTRLLDPVSLLARLGTRLDTLGAAPADLPERQRTLRATFEWSIGLLGQDEGRVLDALSVFADGWTVEAAAIVCAIEEERALNTLDALARHSLLIVESTGAAPRLRMLESLREYARERLGDGPDAAEVRRRHAECFCGLIQRADRPLRGIGHAEWVDRLQREEGNLRVAIQWFLEHERAALPHLFRVLWLHWWLTNQMAEVHAWVRVLMPHRESMGLLAEAELLWVAAATAMEMGEHETALGHVASIEPLLPRLEDPYLRGLLHLVTAWILPIAGDYEGSHRAAEAALEQLRALDEPFWTATAAGTLCHLKGVRGLLEEARSLAIEALEIGQRIDNPALIGPAQVSLGAIEVIAGRPEAGRPLLEMGARLTLESKDTQRLTLALAALAALALAEGDPRRAALALGAADGLRRRVGLRFWPIVLDGESALLRRVQQALDRDEIARLMAEGAALSRHDAVLRASGMNGGRALGQRFRTPESTEERAAAEILE